MEESETRHLMASLTAEATMIPGHNGVHAATVQAHECGTAAAAILPTGSGEGNAGLFTQDDDFDWSFDGAAGAGSLDDFNLSDLLNFIVQDPNQKNTFSVEPQASSWSSALSGHDDHPWPLQPSPSYSSDTITRPSTDHGTEWLAGNNAVFPLISNSEMCTAANTNTTASATPYMYVPADPVNQQRYNCGCQSVVVLQAAPWVPKQLQASGASHQDMVARAKLQEKRQEAMQRYMEKRKNRRFDKRIRYVNRKVAAHRQKRVGGKKFSVKKLVADC